MDSTKASANQNTQSLGDRASEMADSAKHQAQVGGIFALESTVVSF
jgi:hypothetical protein